MTKKTYGFTLIELLVVIAIIAILAAAIIASTTGAQSQARDSRRASDLDEMRTALEMYNSAVGNYPYTGDCVDEQTPGTDCCTNAPSSCDYAAMTTLLINKGYLTSTPQDPLGGDTYLYTYCDDTTGKGSKYALMAKLETESQALKNDYDYDWPTTDACNCNDGATLEENPDPESIAPYTYCIRNP